MDENLLWEQNSASGFSRLLGYRITEWEQGRAVVEMTLRPEHLNRAGLPHGGLLTTLLDTVSGYAGCHCPVPGNVRRTLTLSLTTNFIGIAKGQHLRAEGLVSGGGSKIFFTSASIHDEHDSLIATASGTFRYHRGSESRDGQPRA
ncbi:PaaI family thioesterase [Insolitispirillum peregrinum]|uniref:Uncharacterized domain 1-containing protein n=1 Tax=Insolitispirillum peregrinum TaxID=80876 RepID=A0A1N7KZA3_9PROT|nr:PaaI family thioesterase [Insolitispirillum peregrinum]SIS66939.1 uncharacterized domain 1-containing protein [Insolitispirillum peregrinum]